MSALSVSKCNNSQTIPAQCVSKQSEHEQRLSSSFVDNNNNNIEYGAATSAQQTTDENQNYVTACNIVLTVPLDIGTRLHKLPHAPNGEDTHWRGAFYFVQAADTQLGMIDSYIKQIAEPRWDAELALCDKFVAACNRMHPRPAFVTVCGDLVDAWPGTKRKREQVLDFKHAFAKLSPAIPLVCLCGNHDIGNEPTASSLDEYRADFGDDYFYFTASGTLFIVVNSQFYLHRAHVKAYAARQDEWLDNLLTHKCKLFKYVIILEHVPWFLNSAHEDDEYFNIARDVRLEWLNKFRAAGVNKIFCGHYHRNAGGWFGDSLELVVTSAVGAQLGRDASGARVVRVLESQIEHKYYALDDLPSKIEL